MLTIQITNSSGEELSCPDGKITPEILAKSQGKIRIEAEIPVIRINTVWHAGESAVPGMKLPWSLKSNCGVNCSLPLLAFLDQKYSVTFALGVTNGVDDSCFTCKMNQEKCCYEAVFTIAVTPGTKPFEIFRDDSGRPLNQVLNDYRKKLMPVIPEYPAEAWNPVYCTWYAVHAALTEEYLRRNAEEAVKLGFGTFIVDDGWSYDESKRVSPETLPDWYRDIGVWSCSGKKLPDLKNTVAHAKKLGLKYMFWVAPFFVGRRSPLNSSISRFLTNLHEGQRVYDPEDETANLATMDSILQTFQSLGLDGLKIDFIDSVPSDIDHPRSRSVKKYLESLIGKLRGIKPDCLIEFRQKYATPVNAGLATAFRAGDVPFDYMENLNRCVQLRLILGDHIPVHADPVYFHPEESAEIVGCHMIASLAGVPMLSMELSSILPEHKNVIQNYLSFYREHRQILNYGKWDFELKNGSAVTAVCRKDDKEIVILTDSAFSESVQKRSSGNGIILNMSPEPVPFHGRIFDAEGKICMENQIPIGGRGEF